MFTTVTIENYSLIGVNAVNIVVSLLKEYNLGLKIKQLGSRSMLQFSIKEIPLMHVKNWNYLGGRITLLEQARESNHQEMRGGIIFPGTKLPKTDSSIKESKVKWHWCCDSPDQSPKWQSQSLQFIYCLVVNTIRTCSDETVSTIRVHIQQDQCNQATVQNCREMIILE